MISVLSWCIIIYAAAGAYILMESLVDSWYWEEFNIFTKVIGNIVCVLIWPVLFLID